MLFIYPSIAYALTLLSIVIHNRNRLDSLADQSTPRESSNSNQKHQIWIHLLVFILLALHGYVCYRDIFTEQGLIFGFAQALSLMAWVGITIYWIEAWFFPLNGMLPLILCIAMIFTFFPVAFEGAIISTKAVHSPWFRLHFLTANVAYGIMFLAALQAILMTWQDRSLRSNRKQETNSWVQSVLFGKRLSLLDQLPPLLTMERVLFNMISIGFGLLTIAVFSGVFFSQTLFGRPLIFDHKTVFALISWAMFAGLLFAHWRIGLRGAEASKWVFGSFGVLLLAYVGSRFVLEVILRRV
jgi:ABC-type uncharacterized transport system permease subunit